MSEVRPAPSEPEATGTPYAQPEPVEPRGPSPFWFLRWVRSPSDLRTSYTDDLRIFPSRLQRTALVVVALALVLLPLRVSDFWLSVINFSAIASIGAIGLNLLTGYTGQVSLGHAFFIGLGAYTAGYLGGDLGLPVLVWLPAAGLLGAIVGIAIGPFALRLKGLYLAIVTLGLVFLGEHLFLNLRTITGGPQGRRIPSPRIGGVDLANWQASFGIDLTHDQAFFYILIPLLALAALCAKNLARSRPGRAFQAIRDREVAASVIGVNLARYKVAAFAVSSFYAAGAGALFGSYRRYVAPGEFNLLLSILYVAMIIVGGIGTIFGSILGAFFITAVPMVIQRNSDLIPFLSQSAGGSGLDVFTANQIVFGVLVVVFLVAEPLGLAGIWGRIKVYFRSWPFSY